MAWNLGDQRSSKVRSVLTEDLPAVCKAPESLAEPAGCTAGHLPVHPTQDCHLCMAA